MGPCPWASCSLDTFLGTMVALARTEMWSQPPYKQKVMSLRTQVFFLPKTLPPTRKSSLVHHSATKPSQMASVLTPMP